MPPPPLSGPALRALVAAAEAPVTGDAVLAFMRNDAGIAALLTEALDPTTDPLPIDERPVESTRKAPSP